MDYKHDNPPLIPPFPRNVILSEVEGGRVKSKSIKVAVGMSGGVDSSVAAALLKKQGYDVLGVFLHFWSEAVDGKIRDNICCSLESQEDARRVCQKLKIPFYTLNMEIPFKEKIVDKFLREYASCRTPNPCVPCNKLIKFGEMWRRVRAMEADYVATGHYAQVKSQRSKVKSPIQNSKVKDYRFKLHKGRDKSKDQSYFLHQTTQEQLAHTLFPLGDLTKAEVRSLAEKFGLPTARKVESQEICFIPGGDTAEFLKRHLKLQSGAIMDFETSKILGEHEGLSLYTVGQRKGMKLSGGPWYVASADVERNILLVCRDKEKIFCPTAVVDGVNWIAGIEPKFPLKTKCRLRSTGKEIDCLVRKNKIGSYSVDFIKSEDIATPGQYCVFYDGDECLGGGVIQ